VGLPQKSAGLKKYLLGIRTMAKWDLWYRLTGVIVILRNVKSQINNNNNNDRLTAFDPGQPG